MTHPTKQFPFDANYDFEFRPETYWLDVPTDETFLSNIRGTARRQIAERALEGEELERLGGDELYREAMASCSKSTSTKRTARAGAGSIGR
jgi:hypothetical protein